MTDTIIDEIKAAQAAPADDYIVWAEVGSGEDAVQIVLHTVRLPQTIGTDTVLERMRGQAEKTLADNHFPAEQIATASLHIAPMPTAEEVAAMLDEQRAPETELVLVDLVAWEAAKHRLHLTPYAVGGSDLEMDYKGLKIRRSAGG